MRSGGQRSRRGRDLLENEMSEERRSREEMEGEDGDDGGRFGGGNGDIYRAERMDCPQTV